jgi:hypothetical protein
MQSCGMSHCDGALPELGFLRTPRQTRSGRRCSRFAFRRSVTRIVRDAHPSVCAIRLLVASQGAWKRLSREILAPASSAGKPGL